jgi:hypothetical protein
MGILYIIVKSELCEKVTKLPGCKNCNDGTCCSHYEKRLEKLRFLESELQQVDERKSKPLIQEQDDEKTEGRKLMDR